MTTAQSAKLLTRAPLALLSIAPENARAANAGDVTGLAASIEARGLRDPLHVYEDAGRAYAYDGGRRLRALQLLESEGRLPADLAEGIPCILGTKEDAQLNSLVAFNRTGMEPVEAFLAYNALFDAGKKPDEIAVACNTDTATVNKLLRFRVLAPEILGMLSEGALPLATALAFTITDDHERQRAVAKALGKRLGEARPFEVRRMMEEGAVQPHSRWARFVGREAYVAAGGAINVDLFSRLNYADEDPFADDSVDETWADSGLVARLAEEKKEGLLAQLRAEGWGEVIFVPDQYDWGWQDGYERVPQEDLPPQGKSKKPVKGWSEDTRKTSIAFLRVAHDGKEVLERGWRRTKPKREKAKPETPAQADPALYGWGQRGHEILTAVATEATRVALANDPAAAYDGVVDALAWTTLRMVATYDAEKSSASALHVGNTWQYRPVSVTGSKSADEQREAWSKRLPQGRLAFAEAVAALKPKEKAELLAVCFAETVRAREPRNDNRKPTRWAHLGWLAKRAACDVAAAWKPDAEFLKGGSKDALLSALKDPDLGDTGRWENAKKGEMVTGLLAFIKGRNWVPQLLQKLTDVSAEAEAPEKSMRAKVVEAMQGEPCPVDDPNCEGGDHEACMSEEDRHHEAEADEAA